jgi:putative acetyltransferase
MVMLIGGYGNTGKTLLAHHLMVKYGITYMSIDHIKMGLFRGDPACGFTPTDDWLELCNKLWPIVKGIVMTNIENRQNIIIEGCYLLPQHVDDFGEPYRSQVVPIFLGFSERYIRESYATEIVPNRSAAEDKQEFDDLEEMVRGHKWMARNCSQRRSNYFEVTSDYRADMKAVFEFVDEQLNGMKDGLKRVAMYC